ncbi:MAG: hypothetical protein QGH25_03895 [Candidatus Latescibacteria bacterium]|nr:hypothetical protein [Candidatus Latescibacterota bacterium]
MEARIFIVVRLTYEATHSWPACPHDDVAFLRHPHRHLFHIEAKKEVTHANREIEIIRFKREIQRFLEVGYKGDLETMSCEDLALELSRTFDLSYCQVLEDNENGAEVYAE